jgi:hypothetical protein
VERSRQKSHIELPKESCLRWVSFKTGTHEAVDGQGSIRIQYFLNTFFYAHGPSDKASVHERPRVATRDPRRIGRRRAEARTPCTCMERWKRGMGARPFLAASRTEGSGAGHWRIAHGRRRNEGRFEMDARKTRERTDDAGPSVEPKRKDRPRTRKVRRPIYSWREMNPRDGARTTSCRALRAAVELGGVEDAPTPKHDSSHSTA